MEFLIETERLLVRKFVLDDVEDAYKMNLDPDVSRYTADGGVQDKESIFKRIHDNVLGDYKKYGYGRWAVIFKPTNVFIGFSGPKYLEELKEIDLGFRFVRSYWGQGIATESGHAVLDYGFKVLGFKRFIARALKENKASIRVIKKLGFTFENEFIERGKKVMHYFKDNQV